MSETISSLGGGSCIYAVFGDPVALKRLEAIMHPAVAAQRQAFLSSLETIQTSAASALEQGRKEMESSLRRWTEETEKTLGPKLTQLSAAGDETWNAVVQASVALADTPLAFGADDIARLRAAGLDDAEIVDVIGGAAFFNWANRLMLSLGEPAVQKK